MGKDDLLCPRDRKVMRTTALGDASVEVCGVCEGMFFDSGDMLKAAGIAADPISWDRPETGGAIKSGELECPRCEVVMPAQDIKNEGTHVEIDRCGKCGGVWLDKGELDTIVAIGHAMRPIVDAERAKAKEELAKLSGNIDFRKDPKRKWRVGGVFGLVALVALGVLGWRQCEIERQREWQREFNRQYGGTGTRAKGEEGCPCGCDHSKVMAADLRKQGGEAALRSIEGTLVTIAERENAGYITERMIQHRLRLLDVAKEIAPSATIPLGPAPIDVGDQRCKDSSAKGATLRVCSDLIVHGERIEIVHEKEKLITPSFRLWLEIENLTNETRTIAKPTLRARSIHLPIARWYEVGSAGAPWDGAVPANSKVRVHVIGDIPERVLPHTEIEAAIEIESLVLTAKTDARAVLHLHDH